MLPAGLVLVGVSAARGPARRLHQPQGEAASADLPHGAVGRHRVAAPAGAGQAAAARSRGRAAARQCRDAAAQARGRRGRRDLAGARRAEAAGPRRRRHRDPVDVDEFLPGGRAGRHRHRDARRRCAHARSCSRAINHADTAHRACLRARLPRRARRLLPHADRRPRHAFAADALRFRGMIAQARRQRGVRSSARRRRARCRTLGADAGGELKRAPVPISSRCEHAPAGHPPGARQRAHRRRPCARRGMTCAGAAAAHRDRSHSELRHDHPWRRPADQRQCGARALARHPRRAQLLALPVFAVGRSSADAARAAGFRRCASRPMATRRDLARLARRALRRRGAPLLYLAGEDRAGEMAVSGLRRPYRGGLSRRQGRALPPEVAAALEQGAIDGVLHFSRRSAKAISTAPRAAASTIGRSRRCIIVSRARWWRRSPPPAPLRCGSRLARTRRRCWSWWVRREAKVLASNSVCSLPHAPGPARVAAYSCASRASPTCVGEGWGGGSLLMARCVCQLLPPPPTPPHKGDRCVIGLS